MDDLQYPHQPDLFPRALQQEPERQQRLLSHMFQRLLPIVHGAPQRAVHSDDLLLAFSTNDQALSWKRDAVPRDHTMAPLVITVRLGLQRHKSIHSLREKEYLASEMQPLAAHIQQRRQRWRRRHTRCHSQRVRCVELLFRAERVPLFIKKEVNGDARGVDVSVDSPLVVWVDELVHDLFDDSVEGGGGGVADAVDFEDVAVVVDAVRVLLRLLHGCLPWNGGNHREERKLADCLLGHKLLLFYESLLVVLDYMLLICGTWLFVCCCLFVLFEIECYQYNICNTCLLFVACFYLLKVVVVCLFLSFEVVF